MNLKEVYEMFYSGNGGPLISVWDENRNVGDIPWENRYYECNQSPMELDEENRIIRIPEFEYPGDMVTPSVSFLAPNEPEKPEEPSVNDPIVNPDTGKELSQTVVNKVVDKVQNAKKGSEAECGSKI